MNNFNKELFAKILSLSKGDRSLNQFAQQCEVSIGYLSAYINMKKDTPPSTDIIKKIARFSQNNITEDIIMTAAGYLSENTTYFFNQFFEENNHTSLKRSLLTNKLEKQLFQDSSLEDTRITSSLSSAIPLIKKLSIIGDIFNNENIERYEFVRQEEANYGSFFYLEVFDNSMVGSRIKKGDIAYIKLQSTFVNGSIIVAVKGTSVIIRRYHKINNSIILTADNPNYEPYVFDIEEMGQQNLRLVGKVLHVKFNI